MERTYDGTYSIVIRAPFADPFWSCWPLNEENALTSEAHSKVAAMRDTDFIVWLGKVDGIDKRGKFNMERIVIDSSFLLTRYYLYILYHLLDT